MAATATPQENKRTARRFPEEVATAGNIDLIDEICTEDVIDRSPFGVLEGRDALKEQMRMLNEAFSDFTVTVDQAIAEDDTVGVRVTIRGTHDGPFWGIEPTGTEVEFANMAFMRFEEGKIAERWVHPDMVGMLRQLGVDTIPEAPPVE